MLLWSGYLHSARINQALFNDIRRPFLDAFDHTKVLGESVRSLCGLLVCVAIDNDGALGQQEIRECLWKLDADGRSYAAWDLAKRLQAAGKDSAPNLWREKVGPFISSSWPRAQNILSEGSTTDHLAWAALSAGDAFPDAVRVLCKTGFRVGLERSILIHRMSDKDYAVVNRFPKDAVSLLHSLLPNKREIISAPGHLWSLRELGSLLDRIQSVDARVAGSSEFRSLRERAEAAQ